MVVNILVKFFLACLFIGISNHARKERSQYTSIGDFFQNFMWRFLKNQRILPFSIICCLSSIEVEDSYQYNLNLSSPFLSSTDFNLTNSVTV